MKVHRRWHCIAVVMTLSTSLGCSYSTERPFRDDIQSVHVAMFHSKDFRRELEFSLTEAIAKRVEMETPYRLAERGIADSEISGEILVVREHVLGTDFRTDRPREQGLTVVARWRWKDLRTGEILKEYPRFVHTSTYIPPVGETFSTGATRGIEGMAERIVATMENAW